MSLRILFADDSMTAQSMGKKILSDAGYEVVAVSNGAAAVKKIAEQKPDIIILDVYMPGYTGLEVCEKVRGSMDTLKTPVLLTVGKMEPYRAEDGNRVRADGVIVKPFEASDLLAIVKKLEERISRAPARVEQPVLVERSHQAEVEDPAELPAEIPEPRAFAVQPTVEVPDHMAGNSAFGDLLAAEPVTAAPAISVPPPPFVAEETTQPPPPLPQTVSVPDYEIPVSWRDNDAKIEDVPAPVIASPQPELESPALAEPAIAEPETASHPESVAVPHPAEAAAFAADEPEPPVATVAEPLPPPPIPVDSDAYPTFVPNARPLRIPVYQEPEPAADNFEFMPTSAPPIGEIAIPREPQLQETAEETTRSTVADAVEPGLMTTRQQFEWEPQNPAHLAAELAPVDQEPPTGHIQDIPADIASHAPPPAEFAAAAPPSVPANFSTEPAPAENEAPPADDDFEARVAAALAAFRNSGPDVPLRGREEQPSSETSDVLAISDAHAGTPLESPEIMTAQAPAEPEVIAHRPEPVSEASSMTGAVAPTEDGFEAGIAPQPESPLPTFEYHPPVSAPEQVPSAAVEDWQPAAAREVPESVAPPPSMEPATEPADIDIDIRQAAEPVLESAARAAAATTGADHQAVAQAVHRAIERLKSELVDEIMRELKPKE